MKRLPDTSYTLRDYQSTEVETIVASVSHREPDYQRKKMQVLAELLDSHWEGRHSNQLEALIYDSKNEAYLEASTASSFSKFLVHQNWLPPKILSEGVLRYHEATCNGSNPPVLYKGSQLFSTCSRDIKSLLHIHVPYVDADLQCSEFMKHLKIQDSITKSDLLERLICWSETSQQDGVKFCTSVQHMSAVYEYLLGSGTYHRQQGFGYEDEIETIRKHFTDDEVPLIFVPSKHSVKDGGRVISDNVEGEFLSVHGVCWMDPTSVLYNRQKFNWSLPGILPKILSLHYDRNECLKSAFDSVNVRHSPNIASLIAVLEYNSSLSSNPDKDTVKDFTSVVLHLVEACREQKQGETYLLTHLRNAKVFPSHKDMWVNLNDHCVLDNDDASMAKLFSKTDRVHFLQWPAKLTVEKKTSNFNERNQQRNTKENREEFLRFLQIPTLSAKVSVLVDPGGSAEQMIDLKEKLSLWLPLLQKFLKENCPIQYTRYTSKEVDIGTKLRRLQILAVPDLKCQHFIEHEGERLMMSSKPMEKTCEFDDTVMPVIYVASKKKLKNPGYLCDSLLKLFMMDNAPEAEESSFRDFLRELFMDPPSTPEEIEEMATERGLSALSDEDEEWAVTLPLRHQVSVQEVVDEDLMEENEASCFSNAASGEQVPEEPRALTSWPPRAAVDRSSSNRNSRAPSDVSTDQHSTLTRDDVIGEEDIREMRKKYIDGDSEGGKNAEGSEDSGTQRKEERRSFVEDTERLKKFHHAPSDVGKSNLSRDGFSDHAHVRGDDTPMPNGVSTSDQSRTPRNTSDLHQQCDTEPALTHVNGTGVQSGLSDRQVNRLDRSLEHVSSKATSWQALVSPLRNLPDKSGESGPCLVNIQHLVDQLHSADSPLLPWIIRSDETQDQESLLKISQWGEEYVYTVLQERGELPDGRKIESVDWVNRTQESGKPYDIEVLVQGRCKETCDEQDDEVSGISVGGAGADGEQMMTTVYIEVKSTAAREKDIFEISLNELKCAELKSCDYHVYMVYGVGLPSSCLCYLENLHLYLRQKSAGLFFVLKQTK